MKDYQSAASAFTEALNSLYELTDNDTSSREEDEDLELLTHKIACNAALAGMFCADPTSVSACKPLPATGHGHCLWLPACAPPPWMSQKTTFSSADQHEHRHRLVVRHCINDISDCDLSPSATNRWHRQLLTLKLQLLPYQMMMSPASFLPIRDTWKLQPCSTGMWALLSTCCSYQPHQYDVQA
jgi:hypothetical protein